MLSSSIKSSVSKPLYFVRLRRRLRRLTSLLARSLLVLALVDTTPVLAAGGTGGKTTNCLAFNPGIGGTGFTGGSGGDGDDSFGCIAGGGGGGAAGGGAGGQGGTSRNNIGSSPGGARSAAGAAGNNGTGAALNSNMNGGGGGGGGGGLNGNGAGANTISNAGNLTGGAGGNGGNGGNGDTSGAGLSYGGSGGGGGAGGYGAIVIGAGANTNSGTITAGAGGAGGLGGAGFVAGGDGKGGDGGIGVMFTVTGASLNNSGSIFGGAGGTSAAGAGLGGVGISGSGLTIINSGTIAGGLSGDGVTRANSITFTAGNNTITFSNATSGLTGAIGLSTNTTTLTFNQTVDTVLNQAITGAGSITKTGTGKLTLTATNTYTGTTTISAGTLQVGNGGTTGALGNGNIVDNAALIFNRSDAITIVNAISGTGSLTQNGADTLTLTGALTYTGTTTVNGGSIILGDTNNAVTLPGNASVTGGNLAVANGSLGSGTITVANGRSVIVGSVGGLTATAGSATITDDGTITFQNAGSAGTATINATGLVDFADTATAANSTINLTGGAIGQLRGTSTGGSATFTVGAASSLSVGNNASLGTARVILNAGTLDISSHNAGNVVAGSIEGNGDIGLGANTLQAGGNNRSTTYSGVMSGTGGFTKQGTGDLKFTGTNSYTGNTTVDGGILSVNGSIAASAGVTVNNGGTIGGTGTVSTTVVNNGGTIAPGNSIGTLTVNGNVTFNNGSTYSVEVNSAGAADKLVVNGTITINPGATLAVKPFNVGETGVTYGTTTNYTIITSTGALTGTFSNVTDTFAFLDATVTYGANNVVLTLKRNDTSFASVANTPNQRAAAAGVNSLGAGNTIYGAILGLSAPDARAAFDLLSGEIHASVETAIVEDSRFARDAVNSRMIAVRRGAANASGHVWIQGFGAYGTWASDGNAATAARSTGGFFIGSDGEAFDNVNAGVFAGYSRTGITASARSSSASIDTYQLGAYGGTSFGDLAVRFGGAYSFHDIGTSRSVVFTGLNNTLSSRYQAGTGQLFGEMSYDFKLANGATITPFANLAYVRLDARGFTETGGAAALASGKDQANTLFSTIGVSGRTTIETGTLPVEIAGKVGWRHAAGNVGMDRALNFANGAAFTVGGVPVGRDTAVIDAEIGIAVAPAARFSLRYSGQIGSGVSDHSVNARFDMRF